MTQVNATIIGKFLTNTDHTGRFIVTSFRTKRKYFVEPIGDPHINWGSADPGGSTEFMHKKGDGKYRGSIDEHESLITPENGFANIKVLEPGTSPLSYIDWKDAQYPDA